MIAAGLEASGEIFILDYETLTCQFTIESNGMYREIRDFIIVDQLIKSNEEKSKNEGEP